MNAMEPGQVMLVLHSHLPFVHHPDFRDFLEEDWLFEAVMETYLPLLFVLRDLERDGIPCRLGVGLTPPLMSMLRLKDLQEKARRYLEKRRQLAEEEVRRREESDDGLEAAQHYDKRLNQMLDLWDGLDGDILREFRRHRDEGRIETLASAATHGFLPLFLKPSSVRAQITLGMDLHEEVFGEQAKGFWLPECAYRPGLDALLVEAGVEWVVLDGHGVTQAKPPPPCGTARPIRTPAGLVAFGRDRSCSEEVWSNQVGYPGDPQYRELYRDLGFDGDYTHIRPYLKSDGVRRNLGLKFHRITGPDVPLDEKAPWSPAAARARTRIHARDFLEKRKTQIRDLKEGIGEVPAILAPFDTELFGHWWYEGPWFIEELFRQACDFSSDLRLVSPGDVLRAPGSRPEARPHASSWGRGGFYEVWLNDRNQWFWPYLHEMEERMESHASSVEDPDTRTRAILDQMARELLLAQSSDWLFIVTMETSTWYAEKRFRDHVHRFFALEDGLRGSPPDAEEEARWRHQDVLFPSVDFRLWSP